MAPVCLRNRAPRRRPFGAPGFTPSVVAALTTPLSEPQHARRLTIYVPDATIRAEFADERQVGRSVNESEAAIGHDVEQGWVQDEG